MFELGARWGSNRFLAPVLAADTTASELEGPLSAKNVLQLSSQSQVHQLVADLAERLGVEATEAAAFNSDLQSLVELCKS